MYKSKPAALFLIALLISGCSSSMKISSIPDGAKVYIDQEYKGVTPYVHSDSKPFWAELKVKIKKDNYQDFDVLIRKSDGDFNYGAGCGGLICLPVFGLPFSLWIFKYPTEVKYELVPGSAKK